MACNLTRGRLVDCKDSIGGLKAIFMCKAFNNNIEQVATISNTEMTDAGFDVWSAQESNKTIVFKYDLVPSLSSMTVNVNSDNANGTAFFEQTLSVTLQKIDHDMTNELRLMAYSRAQIFVQDSMDNVYLLGMVNGCHVTGGTVVTGAGKGDMSGYTIEWAAQENEALIQLPASAGPTTTKWPFDGLADEADLTITVGT
tara:strand:+ start:919 stop:1515 length:597 start_codon:yes stop_codon:yes gene_type:complete